MFVEERHFVRSCSGVVCPTSCCPQASSLWDAAVCREGFIECVLAEGLAAIRAFRGRATPVLAPFTDRASGMSSGPEAASFVSASPLWRSAKGECDLRGQIRATK